MGFGKEAECLLTRDAIIIRPIAANQGGELAESILADLIAQGLSGRKPSGKNRPRWLLP